MSDQPSGKTIQVTKEGMAKNASKAQARPEGSVFGPDKYQEPNMTERNENATSKTLARKGDA